MIRAARLVITEHAEWLPIRPQTTGRAVSRAGIAHTLITEQLLTSKAQNRY